VAVAVEEFGWFLNVPGRDQLIVDFTVQSLVGEDGAHGGHFLTLRSAAQRMHQSSIEANTRETECFDNAPMSMVQLDGDGRVMRINKQLLNESGLPMELIIGRGLTELLADPDPRITRRFVSRLLRPFCPARNALAH
jgi:PAS domain-containing protein